MPESMPAFGTKRTRSVSRRRSALLSATAPMLVQPVPPSVENCQVPLVLSMAVMAMPSRAPGSTSAMRLPPAESMMSATSSPLLSVSSSSMAVRLMAPVLSSTGALLGSVTLTMTLVVSCPSTSVPMPPYSTTCRAVPAASSHVPPSSIAR